MKSLIAYIVLIVCALTVYLPAYILWWLPFLSYAIPVLSLLLIGKLLKLLLKRKGSVILIFITLILYWPHWEATFSFTKEKNVEIKDLKLISYNVRVFNTYAHLREGRPEVSDSMMNWLLEQNADVLCLQEFYQNDGDETYDFIEKAKQKGYHNYHFNYFLRNNIDAKFGQAIFSKYPIISSDTIFLENETRNGITHSQIKIQEDTLNLYNMHLQSLYFNKSDLKTDNVYKARFLKMKKGFIRRHKQVDELLKHAESKKNVIIAGDMNDLPYSYSYRSLRSIFKNAFEEEGKGLGASINKWGDFLRIDNIFYSENIQLNSFFTNQKIDYSDHYPLIATFEFEN